MLCWALPGMGPSRSSEFPVPKSAQKDTGRGWSDQELQLNHLQKPVKNVDPGSPRDLWGQNLRGWRSGLGISP